MSIHKKRNKRIIKATEERNTTDCHASKLDIKSSSGLCVLDQHNECDIRLLLKEKATTTQIKGELSQRI